MLFSWLIDRTARAAHALRILHCESTGKEESGTSAKMTVFLYKITRLIFGFDDFALQC